MTTNQIRDKLKIDGYSIWLPQTWFVHHQARIMVYVMDSINVKEIKNNISEADLPSISCEVGIGREKKMPPRRVCEWR